MGKSTSMHLIEFKNAKYFEKDILPYCIIQPPPPPPPVKKNFSFQETTEKTIAHCSQKIAFLLKILSPPPSQCVNLLSYVVTLPISPPTPEQKQTVYRNICSNNG